VAFGEQDTVRLCEQYRDAIRRTRDRQHAALRAKLHRLEQAIRFMAEVQATCIVTEQQIARLVEIARGQVISVSVHGPVAPSKARAGRTLSQTS
jgi:hypothetical protein